MITIKTWYAKAFTPHARGSTCLGGDIEGVRIVYPACAGIDLSSARPSTSLMSLPRMRGDRPKSNTLVPRHRLFTPHARGST